MIHQDTIDQVRDLPIEEVIAYFLPELKSRNGRWTACCPFHGEKSPSFTVTPAKGIFKCFGCGKGGDAIKFVREKENTDYPNAVEMIAKAFNVPIQHTKEQQQPDPAVLDHRRTLKATMGVVADRFAEAITPAALAYLSERKYSGEEIAHWRLGYAPGGGFLVTLAQQISNPENFKSLGLINDKGNELFYERIIFPICNVDGDIVAFGGRTMQTDMKPKYINSPETDIYHKSSTLYGLYQAQDSIRKLGMAILVEGYTDVISMHRSGATNTVATCGTALTLEHAKLLKKYTRKVLLLRDGDKAGALAALRDIDILIATGIDVLICELEPGQDPDDLINDLDNTLV